MRFRRIVFTAWRSPDCHKTSRLIAIFAPDLVVSRTTFKTGPTADLIATNPALATHRKGAPGWVNLGLARPEKVRDDSPYLRSLHGKLNFCGGRRLTLGVNASLSCHFGERPGASNNAEPVFEIADNDGLV